MAKNTPSEARVGLIGIAGEDYLKAIYRLREDGVDITTQALAARLKVAPPSATAMIKKLASLHLVLHTPYRGVELSPAGERIALEVIRHHRLVETYLAEVLGMEWDKVHEEAERWEHVLSEEVEERMDSALGSPAFDPHGAPIPTRDGRVPHRSGQPLCDAGAGARVTVQRVSDESAPVLRHLSELGLVPGARVDVLRANRVEGVLHLRVEGKRRTVGWEPAVVVYVAPCEETGGG